MDSYRFDRSFILWGLATLALGFGCKTVSEPKGVPQEQTDEETETLQKAFETLQNREWVDLTHAFHPGIPHWPGFPNEERTTLYSIEEGEGTLGSGFFAQQYQLVGQWGTHCDPPAHFNPDGRTIDEIPLKELILKLVVFDVSEKVKKDPDYVLSMTDIHDWERRNGPVPIGSFCAMRTDWSQRWPDPAAMRNEDSAGVPHYPGWSQEVLTYLYEVRNITASGHETTDTDPGSATAKGDYSLESYILGQNHYQIELLANLDQVPESGGLIFVSFPKPKGGSGFPARVFAVLP